MQRWAYLFVISEIVKGTLRPRWMQGQELPDWTRLSLRELCNQLGDDGWELVSTIPDRTYYRLIFKRLKTPDRY
jgi:hypothetical protein